MRYDITIDIEEHDDGSDEPANRRLIKDAIGNLVELLHGGRLVFSVKRGDEFIIENEVVE